VSAPADISAARAARSWRTGLSIAQKSGEPKRTIGNTMHVLALHPGWAGVLAYDEFGQCVVTRRAPPVRSQDALESYEPGDWTDDDTVRACAWFGSEVGFEPTVAMLDQAVSAIARKCVVHPVRDWLLTLKWDGTPRLDSFVAEYLGGARSAYSAAVGRKWLISAVARAMSPGCKVDSMLVLEGVQGIGKSSALRMLAGAQWFADTGLTIGDKDSHQALRRKWIYEIAELAGIRGREVERVKNFLSSQVDSYRPSYGRRTQDFPRQVVFAGSTNDSTYLTDPTGARRFWPVGCRTIAFAAIERDRDQLWAEARAAFEAGEPWHLDSAELQRLAALEAAERAEDDAWGTIVERWLHEPTRPDGHGGRSIVHVEDGLLPVDVLQGAIQMAPERITHSHSTRIGLVLRSLGFSPRQVREGLSRVRRYFRDCDGSCDTGPAEKGSCHTGTGVTGTSYTHERDSALSSEGENPGVTPVTCDRFGASGENHSGSPHGAVTGSSVPAVPGTVPGTDDEDIEREAIQAESAQKTQQIPRQPEGPEGGER
jgi:putative DNA primase/helicase